MNPRRAFTLIELLVVIAVIAILSIVILLVINPVQLLEQSRDSNRISDMASINSAIGVYVAEGGTALGLSPVVYVSIPDPAATSTAGDQCQGLELPTSTAFSYHCAASSTYRNVDGTGWLPQNFKTISGGSPLGTLPIDPINQSSSDLLYSYQTNGTQYEMTAMMESQKYQSANANTGGAYPDLYEIGTDGALLGSGAYLSQQTLGTGCSGNYTPFHFYSNVAASFTTGSSAYTVTRVDLGLETQAGAPLVNPVTAYILSDSGDTPGSVLATSSGTEEYALTGSVVNYSWYFPPLSLSAATRYWIEIAAATNGSSYPLWCGSSGGPEYWYYSSNGVTWNQGSAAQLDINTYSLYAP